VVRLHRHHWEPHPRFAYVNDKRIAAKGEPLVRRCTRCGKVEDRAFGSPWSESAPHLFLDARGFLAALLPLSPFDFYLEEGR
jgi:hypothetical protein